MSAGAAGPRGGAQPIIVIAGPTATGKTAVAVELAHKLNTEIISSDSMQVYRHLTIGTAKPTPEELRGVVCHLVDHVPPDRQYSLGDFVEEADALITAIRGKGRVPVVYGGTGMYLKGLLHGIFGGVTRDEAVRAELAREADERGLDAMHAELMRSDPAATHIMPNDRQRILRALEVLRVTGVPITALQTQHNGPARHANRMFVLRLPREELNARIDARVDAMVAHGLLDEVRAYLAEGHSRANPAVRALGYGELIAHVEGELPLEEALDAMKRKTRQYSKRQMTWFRSVRGAVWVDVSGRSAEDVAREVLGGMGGGSER